MCGRSVGQVEEIAAVGNEAGLHPRVRQLILFDARPALPILTTHPNAALRLNVIYRYTVKKCITGPIGCTRVCLLYTVKLYCLLFRNYSLYNLCLEHNIRT